MTGAELQELIFNYRLSVDGSVVLGELPSPKQLDWLLYIDPERNYFHYTPEMAANDIALYLRYQKHDWRYNYDDELDWSTI